MSTTNINPNNRASLLAGLRTGGVRSSSLPHTAALSGSFNVTPFPLPTIVSPVEDEGDYICEMPQRHVYNNRNFPMTAAVDGPNNRFVSQQQTSPRAMNPLGMPFNSSQMTSPQLQFQMMQLEMMRLQALQAQQLQAEILAQQIQQQQVAIQARERRTSLGFSPPATSGPTTNSFSVGPATNAFMRRPSQVDFLRAQLGVGTASTDQVPMTAAIGGRFGSRSTSMNVHSVQVDQPATPNTTTIISGGTPLGNTSPNAVQNAAAATPSKSESASSWRRGGNNNSVLSPNRVVSPTSKLGQRSSPPPAVETSPTAHLGLKFRPQPLRFNAAVSQPLPTVAIDTTDDETDDTHSSGSSIKSIASRSSPTTPRSTTSHEMPLSPREEASKKLFEGLGISRPVSATPSDQGQKQQASIIPVISTTPPAPGHRVVSQPTRQPRGPPSGADELGPKNFATRIRRKAIGGLGMLMGARDRREAVEAF